MVVDWTAGAGVALQATIVHELFHAFQFAHNNWGMTLPGVNGPPWERHWFMEASATWSEHEFVPAARASEVYPRVGNFQEAAVGLASVKGSNEYASWLWPLFMRQEDGPQAIGDAWFSLEGVSGFANLQAAIGQIIPFEDRFGDFAVRAYNQHLEPGDPIDPAFWDVDPSFPDEPPIEPRVENDVDVPPDGKLERTVSMPPLWSHATDLITDGIPTVTFDFDGLTSGTNVTVDLLVKTKEDGWQRRPGNIGKVCDAERVVVILANGNSSLGADQKGTWSATGSDEPCNDGNWTVTLGGSQGRGRHLLGAGGQHQLLRDRRRRLAVQRRHRSHGGRHPPADAAATPASSSARAGRATTRWTGAPSGCVATTRSPSPATSPRSRGRSTPRRPGTTSRRTARSRRRVDVICSEWFSLVP